MSPAWQIRNRLINLDSPVIMGILNVTPDSFYDGGKYSDIDIAFKKAREIVKSGADIIDIGGESSRPGAAQISDKEEINRVIPVIKKIKAYYDIPLSIDTRKAVVAQKALAEGVEIVNDISAMNDPEMKSVVKQFNAGFIIMHMKGEPATMQNSPMDEKNIIDDVSSFLKNKISDAVDSGIGKQQIVIDPGIGFGKTFKANELLINHLDKLKILGSPILIGASRKKFIGARTDSPANNRLAGSIAAHVIAYLRGAIVFRTHDVKETREALTLAQAITCI